MADKITEKMSIMEIVTTYPQTAEIFANYGMACIGCAAARFENVEQAAQVHGFDLKKFLTDLNKAVSKEKG